MPARALNLIPLFFHTARQLRPGQIATRLGLYARRRTLHRWPRFLAWRYQVAAEKISLATQPILPNNRRLLAQAVRDTGRTETVPQHLAELQAKRFHFLNRTVAFGDRVNWEAPGESRLWRYNLHYFDYLWDLILAGALLDGDEPYLCFRALVEEWITNNPIAQGVGWHAYPTARRIVNWVYAALAWQPRWTEDGAWASKFLASLYSQCRFLADHLEWDCRGNHLLQDGKSLLTAGLFFSGPEAEGWRRQGARLVWQALEEQILADGGHYERSPMYHAIVLQDFLEVLALHRWRDLPVPGGAARRLRAMVDFLVSLRHPDGEIPLFGDAALGMARGPDELLPVAAVLLGESRYKWPGQQLGPWGVFLLGEEGCQAFAALPGGERPALGVTSFPQSGYFVLGDGQGNALLLDGGEIGPSEVPAHGHCNTFGYELSLAGRRVVVDSGVETYEPGPWRDYYRSTRAHNTLTVDGLEQSETWAAFRVARRAQVREVHWQNSPELAYFVGAHDGFHRKIPGLQHRRLFVYVPGVLWLIADRLSGAAGEYRLESFVHLHPEVTTGSDNGPVNGPIPLCLPDGAVPAHLVAFGFEERLSFRGDEASRQGWYAPRFGLRLPNRVLIWRRQGSLPHLCGYVFLLGGSGSPRVAADWAESGEVYTVYCPPRVYQITFENRGISVSLQGET